MSGAHGFGRGRRGPRPYAAGAPTFIRAVLPLALALAAAWPARAAAQVGVEVDTARVDTARVDTLPLPARPAPSPADTLKRPAAPADSFAVVDSIPTPNDTAGSPMRPRPAERLLLPTARKAGFAEGVWVFDRSDLMLSTALSLPDLLERVPGLTRIRSGYYGVPETVVGTGAMGPDVEVYVDGYRLDPLIGTTPDLSRMELVDLERVRVVRRPGRVRIELTTLGWAREHAYSVFEGATGDLGVEALRGAFLSPKLLFGPFGVALERLTTDGLLRAEPADVSGGWVRWGWGRENWGVEAEFRQVGADYSTGTEIQGDVSRQDLMIRARARPLDGVTAELFAGRSRLDVEAVALDTARIRETQAGGRLGVDVSLLSASAEARIRGDAGDAAPATSLEAEANLHPLPFVTVGGGATRESWEHGESFSGLSARGVLGPVLGVRAFAEWSDGERGIPYLTSPAGAVRSESRTTERAGLDLGWGRLSLGGAVVRVEGDAVALPALPRLQTPPSLTAGPYPGFTLEGFEVAGTVPTLWAPLNLEGSYTRLRAPDGEAWALLQPTEQARGGVVYHGSPLDNDQLEVLLRVEQVYRGAMLVASQADGGAGRPVLVDPLQMLNLDLQIRVITVRAYLHWENITNRQLQNDLPGRNLPGQHVYFGVKWELFN